MEKDKDEKQVQDLELLKFKKKKRIVVLISVCIFGAILLCSTLGFLFFKQNSKNAANIQASRMNTQMPFYEMTIPGLRSRTYNSKLGDLEEVSRNADYTSYAANYDSEGFKVNGLLTIPQGDPSVSPQDDSKKYPAIVFVHGYIPPSIYKTFSNYADYVDYLARNGFVVFKIDLRGHADSEGEAGGGYYSGDYVVDVLNAKSALQNSDFVSFDKIGFWGHSMAGNVISRAMAASPDTPAIVIWAGAVYTYSDMQKYGIDDNSYRPPSDQSRSRQRRNELFEAHGQFDPTSNFWKMVPMTNYLRDIKGAIQLNHAVNDDVVDIGYSRDLSLLLDKTSIPHELHEYPTGGHNINGPSFVSAMQNTVDFFKKYLQ